MSIPLAEIAAELQARGAGMLFVRFIELQDLGPVCLAIIGFVCKCERTQINVRYNMFGWTSLPPPK